MNNPSYMTGSFEREKNLKASAYTAGICLLLFLLFFFLQWTLPQIPPPDFGEGIEVNLGNSETGSGDIAPQIPGEPSATQETESAVPKTSSQAAEQKVQADAYDDGDAPPINKPVNKPANKPLIDPAHTAKKITTATVTNPKPAPPKPKAVFKGGTSTTTSGNRTDSYNGVRNQGIAGGKGDQGNPNGNPNSDSYKGNAASGNGGSGGTGGVSIRSGLNGRRITSKLPSFEDEFNENAKVAVDITVDKAGNVVAAIINLNGTTTTNQSMRAIALRKARSLKLNPGTEDQQTGTLVFNFKLRG